MSTIFSDLLKIREMIHSPRSDIYIRKIDPASYLTILKEVKNKEFFNFIIEAQPEHMLQLLTIVRYFKMLFMETIVGTLNKISHFFMLRCTNYK